MTSSPANKLHALRGLPGQEPVHVKVRDVAGVGRVAWRRWGGFELQHIPLHDLIGLVYAEGLHHGYQLALRGGEPSSLPNERAKL